MWNFGSCRLKWVHDTTHHGPSQVDAMTAGELFALAAGAGAVITGGIYAAFTVMVLPALDRVGAARATEAMRAVNAAAERPPFLSLFFGTAAASLAVAGSVVLEEPGSGRPWAQLAGAALAFVAFALTVVVNVPLNRGLATAALQEEAWVSHRRRWGRANSVRALISVVGGVPLLAASP